jgi:hypothetical protein
MTYVREHPAWKSSGARVNAAEAYQFPDFPSVHCRFFLHVCFGKAVADMKNSCPGTVGDDEGF